MKWRSRELHVKNQQNRINNKTRNKENYFRHVREMQVYGRWLLLRAWMTCREQQWSEMINAFSTEKDIKDLDCITWKWSGFSCASFLVIPDNVAYKSSIRQSVLILPSSFVEQYRRRFLSFDITWVCSWASLLVYEFTFPVTSSYSPPLLIRNWSLRLKDSCLDEFKLQFSGHRDTTFDALCFFRQ